MFFKNLLKLNFLKFLFLSILNIKNYKIWSFDIQEQYDLAFILAVYFSNLII